MSLPKSANKKKPSGNEQGWVYGVVFLLPESLQEV